MMDPHANLQAFADGELDATQAESFRLHLGTCVQCQRALHDILQLDVVAADALPRMATVSPGPARWFVPVIALAAAAALTFFVSRRQEAPVQLAGARHTEARVSWAVGDAWRPYDTLRGGTSTAESISLSTLAALEQRGDTRALASALLLSGDAARARSLLLQLATSPDVSADLAAVALSQGRPEEALEFAAEALRVAPTHARALWNKGLAARELGLTAAAAQAFAAVATLREPGWSDEATTRQRALETSSAAAVRTGERALAAAMHLALDHQPMPDDLVTAAPSQARMGLAYALRTASSKSEVEALRSVAVKVSAVLHDGHALESLERAATSDFSARRKLSRGFGQLFARYYRQVAAVQKLEVPDTALTFGDGDEAAFQRELLAHGTPDDLVLGLPMSGMLPAQLERYAIAVGQLQDPWFTFALSNERARQASPAQAERLFLESFHGAMKVAPVRALAAANQLTSRYLDQHRAAEAQSLASEALALARGQSDLLLESQLLTVLADAARFRNLRGLALAALDERELRHPGVCSVHRAAQEARATLAMMGFDAAAARAALHAARECGEPLSLLGAFTLSDVLRFDAKSNRDDRQLLDETLATLREQNQGVVEGAMIDHIEGRVRLDEDGSAGEALIRRSIEAVKGNDSTDASKVRSYGFGVLRTEAARVGHFEQLFALLAQEQGHSLPLGCALVVELQDERVAVAGREGSGVVRGAYARVPVRSGVGLDDTVVSTVVAPVARAVAASCGAHEALKVYAGFQLNGRTEWMPDGVAWSFASGFEPRPMQGGPRVLVSDVEAPRELGLPRLSSAARHLEVDQLLRGAEATPERALEALATASFVEFDAHGLVNTGHDDTTMLVLSPGASGFGLTAAQVKQATFAHHPVVVLGACRAATVAPKLHESWSLPHAFLAAGASAVVAAPVDLPDAEAREFLERVAQRVTTGENAGWVVHDERTKWLSAGRSKWVRSVLVFE